MIPFCALSQIIVLMPMTIASDNAVKPWDKLFSLFGLIAVLGVAFCSTLIGVFDQRGSDASRLAS